MIVRPCGDFRCAAPGRVRWKRRPDMPERMQEILGHAQKIQTDPDAYVAALRDWVAKGADSVTRSPLTRWSPARRPATPTSPLGQTHFELATHLEQAGRHELAVPHFREAHRLQPENFSYRRQAWSLEQIDGPLARFWQGPIPGQEQEWPYEGDWLSDVAAMGAENYYPAWRP